MKKKMVKMLLSAAFLFCLTNANAQKFSPVPKSSGDVAYFPMDVPFKGTAPVIRIDYFRPLKKGREIFGKLEKFGDVWRTGANNETQVHFFKDVKIGDTAIPAGTYSLFIIPTEKTWTLIVNKQTDRWGAYSYDKTLDLVRLSVPVKKAAEAIEAFSITFTPATDGANLVMGWDNTVAEFPVKF